MRLLWAGVTVVCGIAAAAGLAAQETAPAQPAFRSRVDLIVLDVTAVDDEGRPVTNLGARDFTVKVDGKSRKVESVDLVRIENAAPVAPAALPVDATISTNQTPLSGRRVIVAVDQTLIRPAGITPLLRTADQFVERLAPQDYASFLAFPAPGPRVDFTLDKARVRQAMQQVVGHVSKGGERAFDMGVAESFAITDRERTVASSLGDFNAIWATLGPVYRRVLERGCDGLTIDELREAQNGATFSQCVRSVTAEAIQNQNDARADAQLSLRALEQLLAGLAAVPGHKSLVLFSAGLVAEDPNVLEDVLRLAAAARTSISVIAVNQERDRQVRGISNGMSSSELEDRAFVLDGLYTIADRTGGRLVRASGGTGQGIFDRIALELSAWYVVAVERKRDDPERQRIAIDVRRPGVTVRSNRMVVTPGAGRTPADRLREALSSPMPVPGLPLRATTFVRRDAGGKFRLHVAAQIGARGTRAAEVSVGYVVLNDSRTVAGAVGKQLLTPQAEDAGGPLHFHAAIALDPGTYSLRLGAVDADGRLGTVIRPLSLTVPTADAWITSDLVVGGSAGGGELSPAVEPVVGSGQVAAYLELYPPVASADDVTVSLEIAASNTSPTLAVGALNLGGRGEPQRRLASGTVDLTLPPGRYVARAIVRRGGAELKVLHRPFTLARDERAAAAAARSKRVPMSPEFRQRTAAYVATVLNGLSQIVAQEDLELGGRRVQSDFLLVRYPGSPRDLLSFRDVIRVNGKDLPDRQTRLTQLFLEPLTTVAGRAREIQAASESYVPSGLNPIFVLAFLQADTQPRFELTVEDAGAEWPSGVKAVTFVETGRPTLIRAVTGGDVPVRGTAMIEESTGRVLSGEVRLGNSRSAIGVETTFRFDEALQITVPARMRTRNPDGEATYSNFRRFQVRTETTLPASEVR